MKYKTFLFDFDGTLVDSMPCWSQKMINILEKNNVAYPDNIIKIITPLGDIGTAKYFRDVLNVNLSIEEMIMQMDEYALPKYRDSIVLKDGVMDYLLMLKKNNCSLNVLTASPHKLLDPCLKRNKIFDLFDNVWSCDDFGTTKADVKIYEMAAEKIGKPIEEILFFDDNYNADKTAKQAGMKVCGVFDDSSAEYIDDIKSVADYYIYNFFELLDTYNK